MGHSNFDPVDTGPAWNAGRKPGAKRPLKPKEVWAVRFMHGLRSSLGSSGAAADLRNLAMFACED